MELMFAYIFTVGNAVKDRLNELRNNIELRFFFVSKTWL